MDEEVKSLWRRRIWANGGEATPKTEVRDGRGKGEGARRSWSSSARRRTKSTLRHYPLCKLSAGFPVAREGTHVSASPGRAQHCRLRVSGHGGEARDGGRTNGRGGG